MPRVNSRPARNHSPAEYPARPVAVREVSIRASKTRPLSPARITCHGPGPDSPPGGRKPILSKRSLIEARLKGRALEALKSQMRASPVGGFSRIGRKTAVLDRQRPFLAVSTPPRARRLAGAVLAAQPA